MSKGISREEKKAIERCKELIKNEHKQWIGISNQLAIEAVLNLIEKQQCKLEINEANLLGYSRQIEKDDFKIEKQQEKIEKQQKEIEEMEIYKSIYKNLRKEFNKMVEKVLGKDYYNDGCDTYTCDKYTCEDITRKKVKILFKDKNSISKEAIEVVLNKYSHKPIEDLTVINFYKEIKELLGE